ncbi:MAG: polysaccharide deacetylase family protein [Proteobacteria bacterium]|nr:polysaccharide deacetylase family protein [Pseudomonadota bacterium]MBU1611213.1 polysaccharide deacetylase family protein [Pseudomonadota bacterium]
MKTGKYMNMTAKNPIAALWLTPPTDLRPRLKTALDQGMERAGGNAILHFRTDDVAVVGASLVRLLGMFASRRVPLAPGLVPAWLTPERWKVLSGIAPSGDFAWHQHGWRHKNHEQTGQKSEFGSSRPLTEKIDELRRGAERLHDITDSTSLPIFTPPWNSLDAETLNALTDLGFQAVSRATDAEPACPAPLVDIPVHADLHTRTEPDPETGLTALLMEIENALAAGTCGAMLRHQRMNPAAFAFLDLFLELASRTKGLELAHLGQLMVR